MKLLLKTDLGKIYHGDARDYLLGVKKGRVKGICIFSDVPYGHGKSIVAEPGGKWKHLKVKYKKVDWNERIPRSWIDIIKGVPFLLFGSNYYLDWITGEKRFCSTHMKAPDVVKFMDRHPRGWVVWDKVRPDSLLFSSYELVYTNLPIDTFRVAWLWNGLAQEEARKEYREVRLHPAQKPIGMLTAILQKLPADLLIVDPFAGSCSLAEACESLGRRYLCIEKSAHYAEIGAARVKEYNQNGRLFS